MFDSVLNVDDLLTFIHLSSIFFKFETESEYDNN